MSTSDSAAIKTYRYLRISMVGAVALLGISIGLERADVLDAGLDCWQTSVSAYYYTPVRAIFVGVLLAIGLCLIVIKGSTTWEDSMLNAAGMLAPVVAVVPTTDVGECWSTDPGRAPLTEAGDLAPWVVANVDNNIAALLVAGIAGLIVAAIIASVVTRNLRAVAEVGAPAMRWTLLAAMGALLAGAGLFVWWDDFARRSHGFAAVLMFLFLALAVGGNAWKLRDESAARGYFVAYVTIATAMIVAPLVMFPLGDDWRHMVLVLEAVMILLFAAYWLLQTREHWNETV